MKWWARHKERRELLREAHDKAIEMICAKRFDEIEDMAADPPYIEFEHAHRKYGVELHFLRESDGIAIHIETTPVSGRGLRIGMNSYFLARQDGSCTIDNSVGF